MAVESGQLDRNVTTRDSLSQQPDEILISIFSFLSLEDLRRVSHQCSKLRNFIRGEHRLWEQQILRLCDMHVPRRLPDDAARALRILRPYAEILTTSRRIAKEVHMMDLSMKIVDLLDRPEAEGTPIIVEVLGKLFEDETNKSAFLWRSSLFRNTCQPIVAKFPEATPEEAQVSARLAVYYGMSLESGIDGFEVHPYARSRVYDLRKYTDENGWGPFEDAASGEVDWERVLAIMVDLGYNLRWVLLALREIAAENFELNSEQRHLIQRSDGTINAHPLQPFDGIAPYSFKSSRLNRTPVESRTDLDDQDSYGVTGTWMRLVCFLDWMNLQAFNFGGASIPDEEDREPCRDHEAIRMIVLKLRVTKIVEPDEDDHPDFPVVHFQGTSRSMHMAFDPNTNSRIRGRIRGTVRTTPSGSIRWTTFSIYHGEERWRSEGVQIGGVQSARGVLGTWFDKDYDDHGPAGPTAFWKLSDDVYVEPSAH